MKPGRTGLGAAAANRHDVQYSKPRLLVARILAHDRVVRPLRQLGLAFLALLLTPTPKRDFLFRNNRLRRISVDPAVIVIAAAAPALAPAAPRTICCLLCFYCLSPKFYFYRPRTIIGDKISFVRQATDLIDLLKLVRGWVITHTHLRMNKIAMGQSGLARTLLSLTNLVFQK